MSPTDGSSSRAPRLTPIALGLGIACAVFAWLDRALPPPLLTDDGIRDQLLVRDCTELGRCHLIGAISSLRELYQGAVWLDLLTSIRLLGGEVAGARSVVIALLAASVATTFVVVCNWLRPTLAFPAAVLLAAALGLDPNPSSLVNASVSAFPDVVTVAALLCYGLSGRRRFLLSSAFALGAAVNVHLAAMCLLPALLAVAVMARPRAWPELLAALAVFGATCFVTSSAALRGNAGVLADQGALLPALASAAALVFVSALSGARFRRLSWNARAVAIAAAAILPFLCASLWLVFRQGHPFSLPYLYPVAAPAAVLAAALLSAPFELGASWWTALRWIPTGASLLAVALVVRAATPQGIPFEHWTLAEAAAVSDRAARRGWSYEDLVFRIQGNACRELLTRMSLTAPPPGAPPRDVGRRLQVVKIAGDAPAPRAPSLTLAPRGWSEDVVPLGPGTFALLREVDSWLRPEALRACRTPLDPAGPPVCSPADLSMVETRGGERFLFSTRSFPEIHGLDVGPPYRATYELPLAPVTGESREVAVAQRDARGAGWRITRVEGAEVEGPLPATRVRLRSERGTPGLLVVEKSFGIPGDDPDHVDMRYPPCLFEAVPGDPLVAFVEAGG